MLATTGNKVLQFCGLFTPLDLCFHTHGTPGVGIAVGIDGGHEVEVDSFDDFSICIVSKQLIDHEGDGGRGDPFTGVDTWVLWYCKC